MLSSSQSNPLVVSIHIRGIAVGGDAVGEVTEVLTSGIEDEYRGITAFVPFANPGEIVKAQVIEKKDKYLRARLLEVIESSHDRVDPKCAYFEDCGGCELQQLGYEGQLRAKFQMIQGSLRAARLPASVVDVLSPLRGGQEYGFRRRIQLHISSSGSMGFYRAKTRSVVSIDSCSVAVPEINALIPAIRNILPHVRGKISSLILESDGKDVLAVLGSPYALAAKDIKEIEQIARTTFKNFLILCEGKEVLTHGRSFLELPLNQSGTLKVSIPGGAFSQVNWGINMGLIERVLEHIGSATEKGANSGKKVFDLYAGAGNFSLPLARNGFNVSAVECDKRLVLYGKESAKKAGLSGRLNYIESSVDVFLKKNPNILERQYVLADPPRSGLGSLMIDHIQAASRLLLISCHLPSFVRDLKALTDRGFSVETIEPFDMFSQTSYVEILAVLGN